MIDHIQCGSSASKKIIQKHQQQPEIKRGKNREGFLMKNQFLCIHSCDRRCVMNAYTIRLTYIYTICDIHARIDQKYK